MQSEPKSHHFIPVGHLARFGISAGKPRNARLWVFDKKAGAIRPGKAGTVAVENDLYTYRVPRFPPTTRTLEQLADSIADVANKDRWIETEKVEMEQRGLTGLAQLERMAPGTHRLAEDERVNVIAYVALLLAQHPTMMRRRGAAAAAMFWSKAGPIVDWDQQVRTIFAELDQGHSVLGLIPDQLLLAIELNYLSWSVVRWRDSPRLVLGDNAVVARFPGGPFLVGDAWTPGASFMVPISTSSALFVGGFDPGLCQVEERDRARGIAEVPIVNALTWVRSAREIYAQAREDLESVPKWLGPIPPGMAMPDQLEVRQSVLPDFVVEENQVEIIEPADPLTDDHEARFRARFGP